MFDIKIEKTIPDAAGEGIGKGAKALGNGTGKGIQSFGQGIGYLAACIGDRIKYGKSFQQYPMSTQLLMQKNGSTIIEIAQSMPTQLAKPEMLMDAVKYQEEKNLRQFIKNVVKETLDREDNNETLPKDFHDTDNLLAIEKAAAETSDDDLSKMWARIFIEEAIQPCTVNKQALNIIQELDKDTALILQNKIFPYCTDEGWCIFNDNKNIEARMLAEDFNILSKYSIQQPPFMTLGDNKIFMGTFRLGEYTIYTHPGYDFGGKYHLTKAGKIIKQSLKIYPREDNIKDIQDELKRKKSYFRKNDKHSISVAKNNQDLFIIIYNNKVYGNSDYKSLSDFFNKTKEGVTLNVDDYIEELKNEANKRENI